MKQYLTDDLSINDCLVEINVRIAFVSLVEV